MTFKLHQYHMYARILQCNGDFSLSNHLTEVSDSLLTIIKERG